MGKSNQHGTAEFRLRYFAHGEHTWLFLKCSKGLFCWF